MLRFCLTFVTFGENKNGRQIMGKDGYKRDKYRHGRMLTELILDSDGQARLKTCSCKILMRMVRFSQTVMIIDLKTGDVLK